MSVRIRLSRDGRKNFQLFKIFVAFSRFKRDGRHLDCVGYYDPTPGVDGNRYLSLNFERLRYWIAAGAKPTEAVSRILGQAGAIPMPPEKPGVGRKRIETADADIPDGRKEK